MRNTLRTQHIARHASHAAHCAPPACHTRARKSRTPRRAATPRTLQPAASRTRLHLARRPHRTVRSTLRVRAQHATHTTWRAIRSHARTHTTTRAPTRRVQQAPSPPPPRTRFRLARRLHRTVRSTPRHQLIARRLLITRAHTQPCATRQTRNTMRAIRPPYTQCARQAPRTTALAKRRGRGSHTQTRQACLPRGCPPRGRGGHTQTRQECLPRGCPPHPVRRLTGP